mmetsp:Transcript_87326/g.154798  ORF Transcript_87326/g.154798 Transcript_87326/m.154798 type:complete len:159 (+) Transcript_87326:593-1069(+)
MPNTPRCHSETGGLSKGVQYAILRLECLAKMIWHANGWMIQGSTSASATTFGASGNRLRTAQALQVSHLRRGVREVLASSPANSSCDATGIPKQIYWDRITENASYPVKKSVIQNLRPFCVDLGQIVTASAEFALTCPKFTMMTVTRRPLFLDAKLNF